MQKRIRARVQRSKYLSLLSGIESREAKPLPGDDDIVCADGHHDIHLSNELSKSFEMETGVRTQARDLQSADPS